MKFAVIRKMEFKFSNLIHSALVSAVSDSRGDFVHIQLINSFLRKVFGVEHIRFYHQNGRISLQEARHPFMYQIAQLVTDELSEELKENTEGQLRRV